MRIPAAAFLLIALAACGAKPTPVAAPDVDATTELAAADDEPSRSGAGDGITAIDAAAGDARAMPADSYAATPYDLAQRAEALDARNAARDARAAAPADAAALGTATNLLANDESVTAGD